MSRFPVTVSLVFIALTGVAQEKSDSLRVLDEVIVRAYSSDRPPNEVPAAIEVVRTRDLNRFSYSSLVPVFNTLPGVRMEERSPGSYRFAIRGSSLRSPFGVRNVKVYWNGLPLTDGGGNTYLNLLDFSAIGHAEVIKGPAGSQYGAGTGGVLLLTSPAVKVNQIQLTAQGGSYGQQRYQGSFQTTNDRVYNRVQYAHLESNGYRDQSSLKRNSINMDIAYFIDERNTLTTTFFYTDLKYATPGGLTLAQYESDPKQSRPSTPSTPGATEQHASVSNETVFGGVLYEHKWTDSWSSSLGIFGSNTDFSNPAIRNFETRKEKNLGARQVNQYKSEKFRLTFGGEYQYLFSPITVTDNNQGVAGTLQSQDEVTSQLAMGFGQAEFTLPSFFFLTVAGSVTYNEIKDNRLAAPAQLAVRKFNPFLSPRVALRKHFSENLTAYIAANRGFSPPTVAELLPSTGIYNSTLNPENGWSYETGVTGKFGDGFNYQVVLYSFNLKDAIVIQRDASGADYYVNAGNTLQRGAEVSFSRLKQRPFAFLSSTRLWTTFSLYNARFGQYINDGNNYSGNKLTGVAPAVAVLGIDIGTRPGVVLNITGNYVARIPLNDANTDFSKGYVLLAARLAYELKTRYPVNFFLGVDNLLDITYSLGNDINAAGARYYNAAPRRNLYAGIGFTLRESGK